MASDDDDDWVGTPPEGRYSRDRANPGFWRGQRPPGLFLGMLLVVAALVVVVILLAG